MAITREELEGLNWHCEVRPAQKGFTPSPPVALIVDHENDCVAEVDSVLAESKLAFLLAAAPELALACCEARRCLLTITVFSEANHNARQETIRALDAALALAGVTP